MKKGLLTLLAAVCIFTGCKYTVPQEDNGTALVAANWAENLYNVSLLSNEKVAGVALNEAGTSYAGETLSGSVTLKVTYKELSAAEKETYLGYGTLDGSATPFKVYVNGREVENMNPKASLPHADDVDEEDIVYLNANVDYYIYTFNLAEDANTVTVSFGNSPELIPYDQLRFVDEKDYVYIDVSDLEENFNNVKVWYAQGTPVRRFYNGLYFIEQDNCDLYHHDDPDFDYKFYVTLEPKDGILSDSQTFNIENNITEVRKEQAASSSLYILYIDQTNVPSHSIIKITD
jgi:hypothetical protein